MDNNEKLKKGLTEFLKRVKKFGGDVNKAAKQAGKDLIKKGIPVAMALTMVTGALASCDEDEVTTQIGEEITNTPDDSLSPDGSNTNSGDITLTPGDVTDAGGTTNGTQPGTDVTGGADGTTTGSEGTTPGSEITGGADDTTTPPETTTPPVETTPEGYPIFATAEQLQKVGVRLDTVSLNNNLYVVVNELDNGQYTYVDLSKINFDANGNVTINWLQNIAGTPVVFNKSVLPEPIIKDTISVMDENGKVVELNATDNHAQYILDENGVLERIITLPKTGDVITYYAEQSDIYVLEYNKLYPAEEQTPFNWADLDDTKFNINKLLNNDQSELDTLISLLNNNVGDATRRKLTIYKNDVPCYFYIYNSSGAIGFNLDKDGNKTLDVAYFTGPSRGDYGILGMKYTLNSNGELQEFLAPELSDAKKYRAESLEFQNQIYNQLANLVFGDATRDDCFVIQKQIPVSGRSEAILGINLPNGTTYANLGGSGSTRNFIIETTIGDNTYTIKSENTECGTTHIYNIFNEYKANLNQNQAE